jgi:hypothetical protein
MRLRIAAFAAVALAAITLLAGCKAASNTNGANSVNSNNGTSQPTATPEAKPSASAKPSAAGTPTDAFREYYEAIKAKDTAAVKGLFSKGTLTMMEEQAKRTNKTVDDVMEEGLEAANKEVPQQVPETRNEKIDGDSATLEVKDEKGNKWETVHFAKEDGGWKLAFDKRGE